MSNRLDLQTHRSQHIMHQIEPKHTPNLKNQNLTSVVSSRKTISPTYDVGEPAVHYRCTEGCLKLSQCVVVWQPHTPILDYDSTAPKHVQELA